MGVEGEFPSQDTWEIRYVSPLFHFTVHVNIKGNGYKFRSLERKMEVLGSPLNDVPSHLGASIHRVSTVFKSLS